MTALYNEIDDFAASWLEELIAEGRIAPGVVDRRSIEDLDPDYVRRFRQVHLFAGIGVWSLALRGAGWPDDRAVWTASCPCQPFSAAGKGNGFDDERHLWPALYHLITQCRPDVVLGEQVASKDGLAWLDLVHADLEGAGYACGAVDTCAAGFGAPHIRQRLYWCAMADADNARLEGRSEPERQRTGELVVGPRGLASGLDDAAGARHLGALAGTESASRDETRLRVSGEGRGSGGLADSLRDGAEHGSRQGLGAQAAPDGRDGSVPGERLRAREQGALRGMADDPSGGRREERADPRGGDEGDRAQGLAAGLGAGGCDLGLADAASLGHDGRRTGEASDEPGAVERSERLRDAGARPGPTNGLWGVADWLHCRDGRWRPVEPGTFPLAHAGAYRNRVGLLRGAGNAVNLAQAQAFCEAVMESL